MCSLRRGASSSACVCYHGDEDPHNFWCKRVVQVVATDLELNFGAELKAVTQSVRFRFARVAEV